MTDWVEGPTTSVRSQRGESTGCGTIHINRGLDSDRIIEGASDAPLIRIIGRRLLLECIG